MKKRLLLAVLLSAAAGGMLYQMSWSQEIPADVDPELGPQAGFCLLNPEDPRCFATTPIPPPDRPLEAPGQDVDPELGPQEGFCLHFPTAPGCQIEPQKIPPPESPVEAPGVGVLP